MKTEKTELRDFDLRAVRGYSGIIGVDEAGRGALAGPVVAAAVLLDLAFFKNSQLAESLQEINDSKQLTTIQRNNSYAKIVHWSNEGLLKYTWAQASVVEIDVCNILGATRLAMRRALDKLSDQGASLTVESDDQKDTLFEQAEARTFKKAKCPRVLIDGRSLNPFYYKHEGVIGGDGKSLSIAMASIVAKVSRDQLMRDLEKEYPHYSLSENKGYGTPLHRKALELYGPSEIHRPLFLRKFFEQKTVASYADKSNQLNLFEL